MSLSCLVHGSYVPRHSMDIESIDGIKLCNYYVYSLTCLLNEPLWEADKNCYEWIFILLFIALLPFHWKHWKLRTYRKHSFFHLRKKWQLLVYGTYCLQHHNLCGQGTLISKVKLLISVIGICWGSIWCLWLITIQWT